MSHRLAVSGLVLAIASALSILIGIAFMGPWFPLAVALGLAALVVSIVAIRTGAGRDVAAIVALVLIGGEVLVGVFMVVGLAVLYLFLFAPRAANTVSSCSAYGAITCASYHLGFDLGSGRLTANLTNALSEPIAIVNVTEQNWTMCTVGSWNVNGSVPGSGVIEPGSNFSLTVRCDPPPGQRNWAELVVEYVVNGSLERSNVSLETDSVFAQGW